MQTEHTETSGALEDSTYLSENKAYHVGVCTQQGDTILRFNGPLDDRKGIEVVKGGRRKLEERVKRASEEGGY